MSNTIAIALSGLTAAQTRLAGSANNVANASSAGALPDAAGRVPDGAPRAYQAVRTVQTSIAGADGRGLGTLATTRPANPAVVAAAAPDSPFANADGMIAVPNVDLAGEAVEQIRAGAAYKAGIALLKTQNEMDRELLDVSA